MLDIVNLVGTFLVAFLTVIPVLVLVLSERGFHYAPEIPARSDQLDRFEYFDSRNREILARLMSRVQRANDRARAAGGAPVEAFGWHQVEAGLTWTPRGWAQVEA